MKKLRWPLLIALLALVAIAVLLVGRQPALLPVQPVVEPVTGGVYTEALIGQFMRLNPVLDYFNWADRSVNRLLFGSLLRFDDRGLPQADLADSWGISRDGIVYNFSLRQTAIWHDGQPVTSDDVIFTIELLRNEATPLPEDLRELWKQIEVRRLDEKTLQFRLPEPFSPFLDYLTFGILPAHLLADLVYEEMVASPFNMSPVGSGPYRFNRLIVENGQIVGVILSSFKDYYGTLPFIEQIAFRYYPDAQSAFSAYQAGEVLGISEVSTEILSQALAAPGLNLHTGRLPQLSLVFLNLDNPQAPFLQDPAVRRALYLGLNRQWMIDRIYNGQGIIADGVIFPGTWAYFEGIERVPFDPEQAIALLREAGYTIPAEGGEIRQNEEGVRLELELLYPIDAQGQALAEAIQDNWARLGVAANLKGVTYTTLVADHLDTRLYQAALVDLNFSRSPDPDPYPFWHQAQISGGQNYARWDDRAASEYLEQARVTVDLAERTRLYNNFQVRFNQELPALPLFYPVYTYAVDEEVQGIRMGPLFDFSDRFATITEWFLLTRRTTGEETSIPLTQTPIP
jgi:peptide/nickel transport system substrate-binding protein